MGHWEPCLEFQVKLLNVLENILGNFATIFDVEISW